MNNIPLSKKILPNNRPLPCLACDEPLLLVLLFLCIHCLTFFRSWHFSFDHVDNSFLLPCPISCPTSPFNSNNEIFGIRGVHKLVFKKGVLSPSFYLLQVSATPRFVCLCITQLALGGGRKRKCQTLHNTQTTAVKGCGFTLWGSGTRVECRVQNANWPSLGFDRDSCDGAPTSRRHACGLDWPSAHADKGQHKEKPKHGARPRPERANTQTSSTGRNVYVAC